MHRCAPSSCLAVVVLVLLGASLAAAGFVSDASWDGRGTPRAMQHRSGERPTEATLEEQATSGRVIVRLHGNLSSSQEGILQDALGQMEVACRRPGMRCGGAHRHIKVDGLRAVVGRFNETTLQLLQQAGIVKRVEPNVAVEAVAVQEAAPWGLDRIDQVALPLDGQYSYNVDGNTVDVYVVDTGIFASHTSLVGRVTMGPNFAADQAADNSWDCSGHGTHVAAVIGGQLFGVAKSANLISVRVLNCKSQGTVESVLAGLSYVATQVKSSLRKCIVNLSLASQFSQTMNDAVQALVDAGAIVVVAAGNLGTDACTVSPASVPAVITVGATGLNDMVPDFSNAGNCVDVYAPGLNILSAGVSGIEVTALMSGTSMAAPHVSGLAALVLELSPNLDNEGVAAAITCLATRVHTMIRGQQTEVLLAQAPLAARCGLPLEPPAPTPSPIPQRTRKVASPCPCLRFGSSCNEQAATFQIARNSELSIILQNAPSFFGSEASDGFLQLEALPPAHFAQLIVCQGVQDRVSAVVLGQCPSGIGDMSVLQPQAQTSNISMCATLHFNQAGSAGLYAFFEGTSTGAANPFTVAYYDSDETGARLSASSALLAGNCWITWMIAVSLAAVLSVSSTW